MPNDKSIFKISLNIMLDTKTDDMICKIAADTALSKAYIIRRAIKGYYDMTYHRQPVCADGQRCRCPHAHIYEREPETEAAHTPR